MMTAKTKIVKGWGEKADPQITKEICQEPSRLSVRPRSAESGGSKANQWVMD